MEQIRHICTQFKLREYIHNIEDARCHRSDLEEASDDIAVFMQMFEPIAESISNSLQNGKDVLDTMNADLENLEAYTQEKEQCIEELSQIIQDELNKQKHDQQLVADLEFDVVDHANNLKSLNTKMLQLQCEIRQSVGDLTAVEEDVLKSRNFLVETTSGCSDLEAKIDDLHHFDSGAKMEYVELYEKHSIAQSQITNLEEEKRQLEEERCQLKAEIELAKERIEMEQQKPVITSTTVEPKQQSWPSPACALPTEAVISTPSIDEPPPPSSAASRSVKRIPYSGAETLSATQQRTATPLDEPPTKRAATQRPCIYVEEENNEEEEEDDEFTPPPATPVLFTSPAPPKRKRATARVIESMSDDDDDAATEAGGIKSPAVSPPSTKVPPQKRGRKPVKSDNGAISLSTPMEPTVIGSLDPLSQKKEKRKQKRQSQLLKARGGRKSDPTPIAARAHSPSASPVHHAAPKTRMTRSAGSRALASKTMVEESMLDRTVCSDDDDYIFDG